MSIAQQDIGTGLKTEELVINMGPQHPSTHGVLRLKIKQKKLWRKVSTIL